MPRRILLVEDHADIAQMVTAQLKLGRDDREVIRTETLADALRLATSSKFDLVLLDLHLPDSAGLVTLDCMFETVPGLPIIVMTSAADKALALQAMRRGAQDYIDKMELSGEVLTRAIRYAIERNTVRLRWATQNRRLQEEIERLQAIIEEPAEQDNALEEIKAAIVNLQKLTEKLPEFASTEEPPRGPGTVLLCVGVVSLFLLQSGGTPPWVPLAVAGIMLWQALLVFGLNWWKEARAKRNEKKDAEKKKTEERQEATDKKAQADELEMSKLNLAQANEIREFLKGELERLRGAVTALETEMQARQARYEALREENLNRKLDYEKLHREHAELQRENSALNERVVHLTQEVTKLGEQLTQMRLTCNECLIKGTQKG